MADELKSMIKQGEFTLEEIEEREKYEADILRRREFNKKQSKKYYRNLYFKLKKYIKIFKFLDGIKK